MKKLGHGAFYYCSALTSVKLPKGLSVIESWTFCECANLREVIIPNTVTRINEEAFFRCNSLNTISIPSSVKVIEDRAIGFTAEEDPYGFYYDGKYVMDNAVIQGYTGSAAQSYAEKYGLTFNAIKASSSITLANRTLTYNGKARQVCPAVVVGSSGEVVYTYYTDSACSIKTTRSNGAEKNGGAPKNVGVYYVKAKVNADEYYKAKTSSAAVLKVIPKVTAIRSLKTGVKSFKVYWEKVSTQTTGYQIQYATDKAFSAKNTITVSGVDKTSKMIGNLKANKKYYVRIRSYKKAGSKNLYSKWSTVSSVTTS